MERKFVPVEQRGKGQANDDSTAPSKPDGQEPHSANTDTKAGTGMPVLCILIPSAFFVHKMSSTWTHGVE